MQPHLTSSLRGTPVKIQIGTPSGSWETANLTKVVLVHGQNGVRANYPTQELDMGTTSIITTSTELHANRMIGVGQTTCNISHKNYMGIAEGSMHLNQPAGTSKTAIFDVAAEPLMDSERELLAFKHNEGVSLPSCGSDMVNSVLSTQRTKLLMPPCDSMLDAGLPYMSGMGDNVSMLDAGLPYMSGMGDDVLNDVRPFSPSQFLQPNPAPSSSQMKEYEVSSNANNLIEQFLIDLPSDPTLDLDLDMNLFDNVDEPDVLNGVLQECGIQDEINDESHIIQSKEDMDNIEMDQEIQVHYKREIPNSEVKKEIQVHCKEELPTLTVPTSIVQPTRSQGDGVGPMRTRQARRASRKFRCKMKCSDDESTTAEVTVNTELDNLAASTSSTTLRADEDDRVLTGEEKYKRNRIQNNAASKRCREKRKEKFRNMELERVELEGKNKALKAKVERLTLLRDEFKKFVNRALFGREAQR